jgi:lysophospholipase L1-like esterase
MAMIKEETRRRLRVLRVVAQRITALYRGAAVLLLNTLVFLACLELAATSYYRMKSLLAEPSVIDLPTELPYYTSQDWSVEYWHEFEIASSQGKYHPWVYWRRAPFEGTTININQDGIRRTPGAYCSANSYKVFAFGGSTMWGTGSPDWGTIPAYLQADLEALRDEPVCVVNFGGSGYVSTQSLIELLIQLQFGNEPDLVIFYDGINDVIAAYQNGRPGGSFGDELLARQLEGTSLNSIVQWLEASSSYRLFKSLVIRLGLANPAGGPNYQTMGIDAESLAHSVTQVYLSNYKIVGALAQEYGFKYYFFWQPVISIGEKPLTREEQQMMFIMARSYPAIAPLLDAAYRNMELTAPEYENLYYIAHVFDEQVSQIWIDEWHVTPVGNQLIVQEMMDVIEDQLAGE